MSSPASRSAHLLHADEEQLDRAAIVLRTGTAFVVVVCPEELRRAALERLRGRVRGLAMPEPVEVSSAEAMLDALAVQVDKSERVLSLALGREGASALDALNLHREKVLKGGPVVLWLLNTDALMQVRERAPDAFSFRSTMAIVRGDGGPLPVRKGGEPEQVTTARKRLKRARTPLDRAYASAALAKSLRLAGLLKESEEIVRSALMAIHQGNSDDEHNVRSILCYEMAATSDKSGRDAQVLYWSNRSLAEAELMAFTRGLPRRVLALTTRVGPLQGTDRSSAIEALRLVSDYGLDPDLQADALVYACRTSIAIGDVARARSLVRKLPSQDHIDPVRILNIHILQGRLEESIGRFYQAEAHYADALKVAADASVTALSRVALTADQLIDRGELDAAERAMSDYFSQPSQEGSLFEQQSLAVIRLARGDVPDTLKTLRNIIRTAVSSALDGAMMFASRGITNLAIAAHDADRLSSQDLDNLHTELGLARDLLLSTSGSDGPVWYPIEAHNLRADLLALAPETLLQAIDLTYKSLDIARATYPDLTPETGRALTDHLLCAARPRDALDVIADVEPYAIENGFLKERALLLANRVLALVLHGDPSNVITPHITALREALAATDSPRITAETLRDLAKRLPPTMSTPDPHAIAEEAHALFLAMPMPAEEARCLEIMGDVLVARGRPDEAKRRYLAARTRLERHGLGLRLPLLNRKLAALTPEPSAAGAP